MSQYKLVNFLQCAEYLLEDLALEESVLTTKYTFRQLKAISYLFASIFLTIFTSQSDQNMYTVYKVLQSLKEKIEKDHEELFDIYMEWEDEAAYLFNKSEVFEEDLCKTISIAFTVLEDHCVRWLKQHKEHTKED